MTPAQEAKLDTLNAAVAKLRQDLTVFGTPTLNATVEESAKRQRDTLAKLDDLLAADGLTPAELETLATRVAARLGRLSGTVTLAAAA